MLSRRLLRTKVLRSIYSHFTAGEPTIEVTMSNYRRGVEACYDLYLLILRSIVDVADYAESRQDLAKTKLRPSDSDINPNRRFVDNQIVASIREDQRLNDLLRSRSLSWNAHSEVIKALHTKMVEMDSYANYMAGASSDKVFAEVFFSSLFEDNDDFESSIEEISIYWADDTSYATSQALKTIHHYSKGVIDQYKEQEDCRFGELLLVNTIEQHIENFKTVDSASENWDLERTAFMDRLILAIAITEFRTCETIPVKVTMDEWIEICKYYTTSSSFMYINGILNRIVKDLTQNGAIQKSGRGLVDNSSKNKDNE